MHLSVNSEAEKWKRLFCDILSKPQNKINFNFKVNWPFDGITKWTEINEPPKTLQSDNSNNMQDKLYLDKNPSCYLEVSVKPRMPDATSIHLHSYLDIALLHSPWHRFHLQSSETASAILHPIHKHHSLQWSWVRSLAEILIHNSSKKLKLNKVLLKTCTSSHLQWLRDVATFIYERPWGKDCRCVLQSLWTRFLAWIFLQQQMLSRSTGFLWEKTTNYTNYTKLIIRGWISYNNTEKPINSNDSAARKNYKQKSILTCWKLNQKLAKANNYIRL